MTEATLIEALPTASANDDPDRGRDDLAGRGPACERGRVREPLPGDGRRPGALPSNMDWVSMVAGAASFTLVPSGYAIVFVRRRRTRALTRHDTTPPTPIVTTGQRR